MKLGMREYGAAGVITGGLGLAFAFVTHFADNAQGIHAWLTQYYCAKPLAVLIVGGIIFRIALNRDYSRY
jgi:hypothetical protein